MSESEDIMQLRQQVEDLRKERDEARREVCAWQGATSGKSFKDIATIRGWECFPETT